MRHLLMQFAYNLGQNGCSGVIGPLFFLVMLLSFTAIYFLPTGMAMLLRHKNSAAIFVLNLFAGWTFVGWLVALVWSFTAAAANTQCEKT